MKKIIPLFLFFILFKSLAAQVVFCPPGADWHGVYLPSRWQPDGRYNTSLKYKRDSIIGADTLKVLVHDRFYFDCNYNIPPYPNLITLLKKSTDTIYFKNKFTKNKWQILYNFSSGVGSGWETTFVGGDSIRTCSFIVDSTDFTLINFFSLKRMYLTCKYDSTLDGPRYTYTTTVTERLGWGFLFNYIDGSGFCDGDYFVETLCYADNTFGEYRFSEKKCDFSNPVGLSKLSAQSSIKIYPNPVYETLTLEAEKKFQFEISDILGSDIAIPPLIIQNNKTLINLSHLSRGIYFLKVLDHGQLLEAHKIIKE